MHAILKISVLRFFMCQLLFGVVLVIAMSLLYGIHTSQSTLFGAVTVIVSNSVLALFLFVRADKRSARQIVNACYIGELLKLIATTIMVAIILHYFNVQFVPFWIGFAGVYSVYWFAPKLVPRYS